MSFKLSLDLHGVVSDMPTALKQLTESIIAGGGEVHILTGSPTKKAIGELAELGMVKDVHYTHVMGVIDYLLSIGANPIEGQEDSYGNPLFDDSDWVPAKAKYCLQHGITLHLDDTLAYGDFFTTPFARLWTKDK